MLKRSAAILVAASIAAAIGLAACGQKAPLYLPGYPKDAPWPQFDPPRKVPPPARKAPDLPGTSEETK
jgi:predicted small lipoprotein YifL